ncbi:MAG: hypothetical protein R2705_20590 [Ilumatobacteraceae bacterium]
MLGVSALTERDRVASALLSVLVGVIVAAVALAVLVSSAWTLPMLRSREELAQARLERQAAKAARNGGVQPVATEGPRPRPAPPAAHQHRAQPQEEVKRR